MMHRGGRPRNQSPRFRVFMLIVNDLIVKYIFYTDLTEANEREFSVFYRAKLVPDNGTLIQNKVYQAPALAVFPHVQREQDQQH